MAYILEADQISKYFGAHRIFTGVSLSLKEGEKAGLVGLNGAGKTTLLNCLAGRESTDEGTIRLAPYASIGFLEQTQYNEEASLLSFVMGVYSDIFAQRRRIEELEIAMGKAESRELEEILSSYGDERDQYERSGGFSAETQVRRVLSGLGFREEQFQRPVASFSGGEKTRIGLARILVREYPLLFLDEPTNHLDLDSIEWLEGFLKAYPGSLLIISHDRYFLDVISETTFDLENGGLKRYSGSYSRYALQKEEDLKTYARAYDKQRKEIEETEAYILRYQSGIKAKQARGRQSRLNRLERLDKPSQIRGMNMGKADIPLRAGEKVLTLDQLSFSYPGKHLFSNLCLEIREGERVALLGPNGAGKTTILKLIMRQLKPLEGGIYLGPSVKPAYFDQEHHNLDPSQTVLQEILYSYDLTVEETKTLLARFLFFAEDADKLTSNLSGGERGRLSLLKLTLAKANFLILDEPTNHLDIQSREIMENYLLDYPGTLLMVSHDRYFIDTLAERVLELKPEGLVSYPGNYSDYRARKERLDRLARPDKQEGGEKIPKTPINQAADDPDIASGPPKPLDRFVRARLRRRLQDLEKEIADLEDREITTIESLSNPDTYNSENAGDQLKELREQLKSIQARLPAAYGEWEETGRRLEDAST